MAKNPLKEAAREALGQPRPGPGWGAYAPSEQLPEDYEDLTPEQKAALPSADVEVELDERRGPMTERATAVEVVSSPVGGETPEEAAESWKGIQDKQGAEEIAAHQRLLGFYAKHAEMFSDGGDVRGADELAAVMNFVAEGKISFNDPKIQAEALDIANAVREGYARLEYKHHPEGYVPPFPSETPVGGGEYDTAKRRRKNIREAPYTDLYKHKTKEPAE